MKKYILVLLMLVSPLMGQETAQDDKKSLYFKQIYSHDLKESPPLVMVL